jgi:hypothetical protein
MRSDKHPSSRTVPLQLCFGEIDIVIRNVPATGTRVPIPGPRCYGVCVLRRELGSKTAACGAELRLARWLLRVERAM